MATSSFTKNFSISQSKSDSFVKRMTSDAPITLAKGFESKYEHPSQYSTKLEKVFGK